MTEQEPQENRADIPQEAATGPAFEAGDAAIEADAPASAADVPASAADAPASAADVPAMTIVRGEGSYLFDDRNNRYIDLLAGNGNSNLGHGARLVREAIQQQAEQLVSPLPASQNALGERLAGQLQERLFAGEIALVEGRASANELALRYARLRHQGQRHKVISFVGSDHGLTLGALSVSGQPYLQAGLGPLVAGARFCPYGDLDAVAAAIDEQTAAILVQPIQTRDGMRIPERAFLAGLRQLADEHGLLLIFDECEIALGSTGQWLVAQTFDCEPDCLTVAAGLAGGLPLAAVALRQSVAEEMKTVREQHPALSTSAVSPLLIAASLAVLESIDSDSLLQNAVRCGDLLERSLQSLKEDFDFVDGVRCLGLIAGLELDVPLPPLIEDLQHRGLIVGQSNATTLWLQLPLNVEEATIQTVAETFHQAFEAIERQPADA